MVGIDGLNEAINYVMETSTNPKSDWLSAGLIRSYTLCCVKVPSFGNTCKYLEDVPIDCTNFETFKSTAFFAFQPQVIFVWMVLSIAMLELGKS